MSKNKEFNPGESETLDINLIKDLPDKIVDMIFQFIFSGPKNRALVDVTTPCLILVGVSEELLCLTDRNSPKYIQSRI